MVSLHRQLSDTKRCTFSLTLMKSFVDYPFCFFRQEKAEKVERVESSALENQRRLLSHAQLELASR